MHLGGLVQALTLVFSSRAQWVVFAHNAGLNLADINWEVPVTRLAEEVLLKADKLDKATQIITEVQRLADGEDAGLDRTQIEWNGNIRMIISAVIRHAVMRQKLGALLARPQELIRRMREGIAAASNS